MTHELKCWPEVFQLVWEDKKKFELRKDDRGFKTGDLLLLEEYDPRINAWSMRQIECEITCVVKGFGLEPDFVALGIQILSKKSFFS